MKTLHTLFLVIHIISGFTALFTGVIPMITRKGGNSHNFWGRIYYWAMFGVFTTTIGLFTLDPFSLKMQFFLPVGVGSFYQTFTGKRILLRKKISSQPARLDWAAMYAVSFFGLVTLAWAIQRFSSGDTFLGILFVGLTALCLGSGLADYRSFSGRVPHEKMHWFFTHLARMLASYAATLTAFLVTVVPKILPAQTPSYVSLITWILPGVTVGIVITWLVRYYKKKMGVSTTVAA
ncbi:hypothetical protein BWI96_11520 [Siphonobacter sp. SORGH_AS_0500]|uniref:DUF2306 domain-containing protein n=1 Tax=Siphonobacter sp. SORGH_AS_0500 TaxID=1864824 RepID=UPI000CC3A957|nr:DUF2306 domain-containing protein [Siphonobacter sp. SORGH_AS_0500]PKK36481.1 hypothetical protein BWI96_11520 [Siphonobacter sp. SORGH_AS_0500]